jgi:hypothetical protein
VRLSEPLIALLLATGLAQASDRVISLPNAALDIEFYAPLRWYASYDANRDAIVLRELNSNGLATGRERIVDSNIGRAVDQGPEFGQDSSGIYLYWCSGTGPGASNIYRAKVSDTELGPRELFKGNAKFTTPSKDAASDKAVVLWVDLATGFRYYNDIRFPVPKVGDRPAWFPNDLKFIYQARVSTSDTELILVDARTGQYNIITSEPLGVNQAIVFWSPELGENLIAAIMSTGVIHVYRNGPVRWDLFKTISLPAPWIAYNIEHPEGDRVNLSQSYLAVNASTSPDARGDHSVWLVEPFGSVARVDNGARGTKADAECAVIDGRLFILYHGKRAHSINTGKR